MYLYERHIRYQSCEEETIMKKRFLSAGLAVVMAASLTAAAALTPHLPQQQLLVKARQREKAQQQAKAVQQQMALYLKSVASAP